ncbi:MAG: glycosyltransferase family 4 protein [Bilophila sp.]
MNVIILNNQARALVNFWSSMLMRLRTEGHSVRCFVPGDDGGDPEAEAALRELGATVCHYPLDRKGLNPFRDFRTFLTLYRLFREERAAGRGDLLYASTIKPVIYGLPAAFLAGVSQRYAMITGLGYMFEADSPIKKVLTCVAAFLYRVALTCSQAVFFQNTDDIATFRTWHCLPASAKVVLTRGTGVDTVRFAVAPTPKGAPIFLFVGRLLEAKGLYEYAEAARKVKAAHPDVRFQLLGPPEEARGGVPMATIRAWEEEGVLEYLGETRDVRPFVTNASVVVLPSWREGLPCSLMEAMSMGRAVVATDVPGCRDVVVDGQNGFLVPVHNPDALAQALEAFLSDEKHIADMGQQGRKKAEEELDARKAVEQILNVMGLVS